MISRFALFILFLTWAFQVNAQTETLTTFILVRHAEKEGQNSITGNIKDPKLSEEGQKRAERLMSLFAKTIIDAVYSTPFIRTKSTVEPLAKLKSLTVLEYEPGKLEVIDKMTRDYFGKTIMVCGHSNTIPKIANHLIKTGDFKDFDDADYSNILIITVSSTSKSSKVTWLKY